VLCRFKLWRAAGTKEKYGLLYDAFKKRDYLFVLVQYFLLNVILSAFDIFFTSVHGHIVRKFLRWLETLDTGAAMVQTFKPVSESSCR
jgi:hypothetical protein